MEIDHGKIPMDNVGGTIKNQVVTVVKLCRSSASTPKEFLESAQDLLP